MADAQRQKITVRVVFGNHKALRAFGVVLRCLDEVAEDMPWRDDVKGACRAARYAIKHLKCISTSGIHRDED